jgi:hypothetical protein
MPRAKNAGKGRRSSVRKGTFKHTADHPPHKTAALALIYRDLYFANVYSAEEVIEFCEEAPGELGPLAKYAAMSLTEADWFTLRIFEEYPDQIASWANRVHEIDPARAEALLHFWPKENSLPPFGDGWTYPYIGSRWDEVEAAMLFLESRGLTAKRDEVDEVARQAWISMGGDPSISGWLDLCEAAEESAAPAG